ncbi:hypothetical protein FB45DRAFT_1009360 [Roridomyces roridus]|uniref:Secreted protein n=1 Tax=Roridomyces roridus TaxID=1738132 RepID=A0AAD7B6C1_9AGAR|nr:hypothetical protein FB45DRAFT_1009360 [Roridomyces roridus]
MRFPLLLISLWALLACALAWPFPTRRTPTSVCDGSNCPPSLSGANPSIFAETGFLSNAERLQRGLPLLKPTQRRPGVKVAPRASAVPRARSERADRSATKRTISVHDL